MTIGNKIIDEVIKQPLFRVECPDAPESGCLIIWNGNAASQLDALVAGEVQGASQVEELVGALLGVVDRFTAEFTLPAAAILGCVETVKMEVWSRMQGNKEED
jgi:hypothetical protein